MIKIENHCVNCQLDCLGESCGKRKVKVAYCDYCDYENYAVCQIADKHLCWECARDILVEQFSYLTLREMAEKIGITIKPIDYSESEVHPNE